MYSYFVNVSNMQSMKVDSPTKPRPSLMVDLKILLCYTAQSPVLSNYHCLTWDYFLAPMVI